jgi:hypothetical protein
MHPPATLLAPAFHVFDLDAVRAWGRTAQARAVDAVRKRRAHAASAAAKAAHVAAVARFFGSFHPNHAFRVEPLRWLSLTEVQATTGLSHFLAAGGEPRIAAFLRALDPAVDWTRARGLSIAAELRLQTGRADLVIVERERRDRGYGAVVEAKFGHHLRHNPLAEYKKYLTDRKCVVTRAAAERTGTLKIVGIRCDGSTVQRLRWNRDWSFIDWSTFLRRFEIELAGQPDDVDFRRFRRTLWERVW